MIHKKCKGRVLVDRLMSEKQHVELACLMCGERWMLNKEKNRLAKWVHRLETMREGVIVSAV
jgi:hypothetical protein